MPEAPFFILITGNARSGTTFITSQIEKSFDIAIPVESFFIPHFERYAGLYGLFTPRHNSALLVQCVQDYLEISLYTGVKSAAPDKMLKNSILGTLYTGRDELIDCIDYRTFLTRLFYLFAKERKCSRWGERGMNYELEHIERYDRSLDNLRLLHIVRDGRDVTLSWMKEWFGPKTVAESAYLWRKHVKHYRKWGENNPNRYLEVRYEEFLANPVAALECIGEFFDLKRKLTADNEPGLQESLSDEVWARNIAKPIISDNIGKWRDKMNKSDVLLFEKIAGKELELFGYERTLVDFSLLDELWCQFRFCAGISRRFIDPNFYKRRFRRHLPLGLLILRSLMSPIVALLIDRFVLRGNYKRGWNEEKH